MSNEIRSRQGFVPFRMGGNVIAAQNPKADTVSPPRVDPATKLQQMASASRAVANWAKRGFTTVTQLQHDDRLAICNGCEFWNPKARFGLGKCGKCGCTALKLWLPAEKCPLQKWPEIKLT